MAMATAAAELGRARTTKEVLTRRRQGDSEASEGSQCSTDRLGSFVLLATPWEFATPFVFQGSPEIQVELGTGLELSSGEPLGHFN